MLKRLFIVTFVILVGMGIFGYANADNSKTKTSIDSYVVVLKGASVLQYTGGMPGYPSTRPAAGQKIDPSDSNVRKYAQFLTDQHTRVLAKVGASAKSKVYSYVYLMDGFSALMTQAQAAALAKQPQVLWVARDRLSQLTTDASPDFLELTDEDGAWENGYDGTGVVVGIIDTGIWPEHPSFQDDDSYPVPPVTPIDIPHYPACDFGNTSWNSNDVDYECDNKLIGARTYLDTYKRIVGLERDEYDSARDNEGHGTHTAATAAGNAEVESLIFEVNRGEASGMAPRAHLIAYKACAEQGCFNSDTAAAIDQGVADGVDVFNFSIGGASLSTPNSFAFLRASDAGVFVATSAGNSGPGAGTVGSPAVTPWVTAVGASTHDRAFLSDITLEEPDTPPCQIWGGSVTPGIEDYNLVDAEGIADSEGDTTGLCLNAFLPSTFQANDAVLCNQYDFGVARVVRVQNVAQGGGGAVLFHNSPQVNVTPTDNHVLPTVHMLNHVGQPLKDYLVANPGQVKVSFTTSEARYAKEDPRVIANVMASFSSRGPNTVAEEIIKPDVTAPGVSILAGNTPTPLLGAPDQLFQAIMGTSMSSPHVAGIYALVKQAHPEWSPAMARSALMTTAYQKDVVKEDFITPADPFDFGAGHINPEDAVEPGSLFDPGLVYQLGTLDYLGFLCDKAPETLSDPETTCAQLEAEGIPTLAMNLNYPSVGIAAVAGSETVVRTLTSVALDKRSRPRLYHASVTTPPGYEVKVNPSTLRLRPGQTASYQITVNNQTAPIDEWRFGAISWRDRSRSYEIRSPLAVRASLLKVPAEIAGEGATGTAEFDISFGYTGDYEARPHGLVPVQLTNDNVLQDEDQTFDPSDVETGGANLHEFTLTGAAVLRLALPPESTEQGADLDIYVYDPNGELAASSTSPATDELVDILLPMDGTWRVYVHGWLAPGGDSDYVLQSWVVSKSLGDSLAVVSAPSSATLGVTETVTVGWNDLAANTQYLGAVSHNRAEETLDLTLVKVEVK